ncbi:MAG: hypothetical protein HUU35_15685, partial [Armatimonadetes bacterium]|nr:hypothetical protein [Armatimonadota bacterium]
PFCPSAAAWDAPPLVLAPYAGAWQVAASRYRRWFDSQVAVLAAPPWVRECSGWLLAVLKQQHGEVMWDYRTGLDELCDLALERGLDVLGLFGWAHGGHDGRYPEHYPDPLMGGAPALRAALTRARERGLRTILYANGSLIDTATDFYRYVGNEALALRENRELYLQSIRKFHSATPVTFAMGCLGAEAWRRQLRSLAQQALELGADGILFDQLGVFGPLSCFATHHRHATPAEAFTRERVSLLSEIATAMRQQNPEFVVATEGVIDALAGAVGFYHGWGTGFAQPTAPQHMFGGENAFGDLFRATFPELVMTQRQANPMTTRAEAHYALVHGLRHEIETRYPADVRYLREGRLPEPADYADCAYYPPDVETVRSLTADEAAACLQALTAFGQRHAAFLRHGRFVGERGFINASDGLVAKAFTAGDQLAVCVWNPTAEARPCEISVPNGRLVSCAEPHSETVDPASPLGAETVRLLVFAR